MKKALLPLCIASVSFSAWCSDTPYTMEDLQALSDAKNWSELLAHVGDIRPSQRNKDWQILVEKGAVGAFDGYVAAGATDNALGLGQHLLATYPFLSESQSFTQGFTKQLIPAAQPCIQYSMEGCVENYGKLMVTLSPSGELSFEEGTKVFQAVSKSLAVPFFASAVNHSAQYCSNETVANALLYTLDRPKNVNFNLAKDVAINGCANTTLKNFENYIIESQSVRQALCPTYLSKGYVKGIMKKVCES